MRQLLALVAGSVVAVAALTGPLAATASAAPKVCKVKVGDSYQYRVCSTVPGAPGTPGGGETGSAPECELTEAFPTYCKSEGVACRLNDPALNPQENVEDDAGPKPESGDEDYYVAYESCSDGSGRGWFWTTGETVSREDLALQAYGELTFPAFTATFNPPNRTIVNLDTWWWAEGAGTQTLIGSSADGIRALATPDRMEVDPGDGSGVFSCAFSTARSDECSYAYRRASTKGSSRAADGSAAYPGRMRLVWTVSFEDNGAPMNIDGLPTTFSSPWQDVPVPVREVQTLARPNR